MEETGTYLQADGKDKEDEAELLHEVEDGEVGVEAQVAHQDTHKQDPGGAQGNAFYLKSAQIKADANHKGQQQNGVCNAVS